MFWNLINQTTSVLYLDQTNLAKKKLVVDALFTENPCSIIASEALAIHSKSKPSHKY